MTEAWKELLAGYRNDELHNNVVSVYSRAGKNGFPRVFPAWNNIFRAFSFVPPKEVKVVILGQDPYHNVGQAHGLAFSVPDGIQPPPSLQNIFKERNSDIGMEFMMSWRILVTVRMMKMIPSMRTAVSANVQ